MKLWSLGVEHFRGIRKARLDFGHGLNVLHGPNDLGKSSLAAAIRAALLLQVSSKESEQFLNWHGSGDPQVELVFESEPQRIWRIRKTFGSHPQAFLDESRDGVDFRVEARSRDVDGRLSDILRWGLAPPGGKGRPKGMPVTFLSSALMAEQDQVAGIFAQALSADSDESGKKRLMEALQAVAEDPIFKSILHVVQAKVEEAFAASGQKRRGKDSPWIKIQDQIQRAEEEERQCSEQLQKTLSIESELQDLLKRRLESEAALDKVSGEYKAAEEDYGRGLKREAILQKLRTAQRRVDEIVGASQELASTKARLSGLVQRVTLLEQQETEAKSRLAATDTQVKKATEEVRVQSADQERESQLRQSALQKKCAELRSEQALNDATIGRVRAAESVAERAHALETSSGAFTARIIELTGQYEEAARALREVDEQQRGLAGVAQLLCSEAAQVAIAAAENALAQIETWRAQAAQQRGSAQTLENAQNGLKLPAATEIEALKRLEQELQVARARLGVGLHLTVIPKRELRASIRRDGGAPEPLVLKDDLFNARASGEMHVDLEGIAEISISGGEESARAEMARLQGRWSAEVEPVLEQADLASLDEVGEAVKKRTADLEEMRRLRNEAAALEQRISDQRDWVSVRAEKQRELNKCADALAGEDRKALQKLAQKLRIKDLLAAETSLSKLAGQRPTLLARERSLEGELASARLLLSEKQKDLAVAQEDLLSARAAIDGYSEGLLAELLNRQSRFAAELLAAERELQGSESRKSEGLVKAQEALASAEKSYAAAVNRHSEIANEWRKTDSQRASAEGELKVLSEAAAKLDEQAARLELGNVEAELARVPEPARAISEQSLTEARTAVKEKEADLREIDAAIQSKRGALEHVGGQVAKDRSEGAREALALLREQERSLEVDYEAWALLRDTLVEAEQQEGVHLGRVLGGPIFQRFGDLTGGRYGKLTLGSDLATDTISVAGEGRPVDALSIGTRDQLSLIFRLTLAEQLKSVVVLDDQLTQCDGERMVWMRSFIREMARNIQIIVFTCRPTDYLVPAELKSAKKADHFASSFRATDLTEVIERSGLKI
jgi:DNA repair exonuclease SbcCD ATPase subunit